MIHIDYRDSRPIYEQLVDRYERLILKGALKPEEKLPSVRQVAAELSVNPNTVQKVYVILEDRRYIYSVRGKGNFVADPTRLIEERRHSWTDQLASCLREGRDLGISPEDIRQKVREILERQKMEQTEGNHD